MNDSLTLYKLVILFMLNKVNFPLSTSQISECILDMEYTGYFTIQQALHELMDSSLVKAESSDGSTHYTLTKEGEDTLSYFGDRIPKAMTDDLIDYLNAHQYKFKNEAIVHANYSKASGSEYLVHLSVTEGASTLIDLSLSVPDEALAASMCHNWRERSTGIYEYLFEQLM